MSFDRRRFLKAGLSSMAYFTLEATTPNWIMKSAMAAAGQGFPADRILVILQQAGGNDGLNTVIPRTDPIYYDAAIRPTIGVPAGSEINLDGLNGLHPRLAGLADWYQRGKLAVVNNVGYANPSLSHFTSTDYWEYGSVPGQALPTQGWISRFFDNACAGAPSIDALKMVVSGTSSLPNSMSGSALYTPPAIQQASSYSLATNGNSALRLAAIHALNNVATINPQIDFLQRSANLAEASVADIAAASALPILLAQYTTDSLGRGLQLASQIIRGGFDTSIFYVSHGGYDTHSGQVAAAGDLTSGLHPVLLAAFDRNINTFLTEMELSGNLDRVVLMSFTEFGRRVAENGSRGTDHGAGNCLFVAGGKVAGGVYGGQPNLASLLNGNLRHLIDFRSVYSEIMQNWLGQDPADIFGAQAYAQTIGVDLPKIPFIQAASAARQQWRRYA